jgi:hypothetical protein
MLGIQTQRSGNIGIQLKSPAARADRTRAWNSAVNSI